MQVVYLGSDPRKHCEGVGRWERRVESPKCVEGLATAGTTGPSHRDPLREVRSLPRSHPTLEDGVSSSHPRGQRVLRCQGMASGRETGKAAAGVCRH